jgi:hypothetical protein
MERYSNGYALFESFAAASINSFVDDFIASG